MAEKNISIDIIKEISSQLQLLYGHATADILPIVLHSIRIKSIFELFGDIAFILTIITMIKFAWIPFIHRKTDDRKEWQDREFENAAGFLVLGIFTFLIPFVVYGTITNMSYIFCPEAKIIFSILDGLK